MQSIVLHNSLTGSKQRFAPAEPGRVTVYLCGPTVYNFAHIGNARPPVVFDVLRRMLNRRYDNVVFARNITDVDDKINAAAADEGVGIDVIAQRFTQAYHQDMGALGVQPPDVEPFVTAHIHSIIEMNQKLLDGGFAYQADGHVLFAVDQFADYGALSRRDLDEMLAGARVEVADYKRAPGDFVLWKPSTDEQPGWDSPWGRGRPGWHIECSAMIARHLGETIDIHAGGRDLIFPHHENEVAQSRCATGNDHLARFWLHNGLLTVEGKKMSKSLGNVFLVRDLLGEAPAEAIRLVLLSAHYRQPLDWSEAALQQARATLDSLYGALRKADGKAASPDVPSQIPDAVDQALADDLNTPKALAALSDLAHQVHKAEDVSQRHLRAAELRAGGAALGLLQQDPESWFSAGLDEAVDVARIERFISQRETARDNRDFARADEIRDDLEAMGVVLEDSADGTRWRVE